MSILLEWWKNNVELILRDPPKKLIAMRRYDSKKKYVNIVRYSSNTMCCFIDWGRYEFFYEIEVDPEIINEYYRISLTKGGKYTLEEEYTKILIKRSDITKRLDDLIKLEDL